MCHFLVWFVSASPIPPPPRHLFSYQNKTNSIDSISLHNARTHTHTTHTHTHTHSTTMEIDRIKGLLKSCWKEVGKNRGDCITRRTEGEWGGGGKTLKLKAEKTPCGRWTKDLNEASLASRATELSIKFRLWFLSVFYLFVFLIIQQVFVWESKTKAE